MKTSVEYKLTIINCIDCPYSYTELTPNTGFGLDYYCSGTRPLHKLIKCYCETSEEFPQDNEIPDWCPLG